ncbi:hypothetical protein [Portibacter marinus]|uniref:hypothetical protein n=1 Tax=Portibacter marinus TaxID=2898660 RepID=UPI001F26FB13|nr:hypothetical protein [Portibacter marinus]
MEKHISSSFTLSGPEKLKVHKSVDKLSRFDSHITSVSIFFTEEAEKVKCITEVTYLIPGRKEKRIIKNSISKKASKALKKALKKVKTKMISVVVKYAKAA